MNVHVHALLLAFVEVLAAGVGLAALAIAARAWRADANESRLHLAFTLGQALVVAQLAAWPLLYAYLQSLVPVVPGAMCVYGVTREGAPLTVLVQTGAPLALFAGGVWFVCRRVWRDSGALEAAPRVVAMLGGAAALAVAQAGAVLLLVLMPRGRVEVQCCSTVFDQPGRFTARLPAVLLGAEGQRLVMPVALGLLAAAMIAAYAARRTGRGMAWVALVGVASLASGVVYLFEIAAPRLLGQPGHHCLFDVVPLVPSMGLALLAFALGHFMLGWAVAASAIGPLVGERASAAATARACLAHAVVLLAAYAIALAAHLTFA